MTHQEKAVLQLIRRWRRSIRHARAFSQEAAARDLQTGVTIADTFCQATTRHARQLVRILRRTR